MSETVWHIKLLGGLQAVSAQDAGRVVSRFRTQKTAALLAYLALHKQPQSREVVSDVLWPDEPVASARNALRVALSSLRRQLEPAGIPHGGVLRASRTDLHLNPAACTTDVAQFEILAARAQTSAPLLSDALALYGGELLPGFYEDWVIQERERVGGLFLRTLRGLAHARLSGGDFEAALAAAQKALQNNPHDDEAARLGEQVRAMALHNHRAVRGEAALPDVKPKEEKVFLSALPTPRALSTHTTLPFSFSRFFGRETEKKALCDLMQPETPETPETRHITLLGAGGSGKTRLAIEVGRALLEKYHGAVYFVSLGEQRDAQRIKESIARALSLPHSVSGDYGTALVQVLSASPVLLILDGFEQLAADGGPMVSFLLQEVPDLKVLVTSRRRLEIPGEREVLVAPLPLPFKETVSPEALIQIPAIQLFCDRAQAAQSDFALTARNAPDIVAIVTALDGVPLALELAAARIRTLGAAQMQAQITASEGGVSGRFSLLTARHNKDKTDRHRSLWAAISWSFDLLPPPLRQFFANLSVFQGGWTTEAAQAVCEEPFAAEYLIQLRAHSLVVAETLPNEMPRFRLLDSLREFAREQISETDKTALQERHGAYFVRMAEKSEAGLRGKTQQEWLEKMDADYPNFYAVLLRGGERGLQMVGFLRQYWLLHGPLRPSAEIAAALLDAPETPENPQNPEIRAAALSTLGTLYLRLGDYKPCEARLNESLDLFRLQKNEAAIARVLSSQGVLQFRQGDLLAGQAAQKESLEIRRCIGDKWGAASSYLNLGAVTHDLGDKQAAAEYYEKSLVLSREIGDTHGMGAALGNLANIAAVQGNRALARARYEESLQIARAQNIPNQIAVILFNLGGLLEGSPDNWDEAERYFAEAYELYQKAGEQAFVGAVLMEQARMAIFRKNTALAHAKLAESASLPLTRGGLCVVLETFAHLFFESGEAERCVTLYGAADALRTASRFPRQTSKHEEMPRQHLSTLRLQMGDNAFAACWEQGQAMTPDDACTLARQPLFKKRNRPIG